MNPQNHIGKLILLLCLALPVAAHAELKALGQYRSGRSAHAMLGLNKSHS